MMYQYEKDYYNTLGLSAVGALGFLSQIGVLVCDGYQSFTVPIIGMNMGILVPSLTNLSKKKTIYKIFNDIKNTYEFVEQKQLYDDFITDIAVFFKELGIKPDLRGAFFIKMCMDAGLFSEDRNVQYATFEKDYFDRYVDVMGARIATGAFCCRHAASLVTDIINKMGGVACDIAVYRDIDKNGNSLHPNHLVTGIVHKGKVVLYEASVPMSMMTYGGAIELKTKSGKIVSKNEDNITYSELSSDYDCEKINKRNRKTIGKMDSLLVEGNEDLYGDYMDTFVEYISHHNDLERFYRRELPKIKRLSFLNKQVVPHGENYE